ncbi:MAG: 4-phosphoerythronate dehydrogenase [Alistipes sp.]
MLRFVVDENIPFLKGVLEPYAKVSYCSSDFRHCTTAVDEADALIIRTRTKCNEELLKNSRVQLILTATIGFDHIDMDYCRKKGIEVATAAGCNARAVLQWMAAVLVHRSKAEGWEPTQKRLGIIGVGHVGSLVQKYAQSWGFHTLCCDPPREQREHLGFLSAAAVVRQSDILTFHTPLDDTTHHLGNAALFAELPDHALIINASRGAVVDQNALLGGVHPYILDVWEGEPNLNPQLLANAILATPHIAGYSAQGKANATMMVVHKLATHFGLPLTNWHPPLEQVTPPLACPITWRRLCESIDPFFNIAEESRRLKANPWDFENIRDTYTYRNEYF